MGRFLEDLDAGAFVGHSDPGEAVRRMDGQNAGLGLVSGWGGLKGSSKGSHMIWRETCNFQHMIFFNLLK